MAEIVFVISVKKILLGWEPFFKLWYVLWFMSSLSFFILAHDRIGSCLNYVYLGCSVCIQRRVLLTVHRISRVPLEWELRRVALPWQRNARADGGSRIKARCSSQRGGCCRSLQPQLFSSSSSVCCEMLRRLQIHAGMQFVHIFTSDIRSYSERLCTQTAVQWYCTSKIQRCTPNASPPWVLLRIKIDANPISDSEFKLVSKLHDSDLWLAHNQWIECELYLHAHTPTQKHTGLWLRAVIDGYSSSEQ